MSEMSEFAHDAAPDAADERRLRAPNRERFGGAEMGRRGGLASSAARRKRAGVGRPKPTTDDELHEWIEAETGFNIPRVSVCDDHCAPFDFIADAYFERERALFQIGSRELGKTLGVSIVHYVNSETRPGCTSCTFGAIQAQANRAYQHVTAFVYEIDADGTKRVKPQVVESLRSRTEWRSGSTIEILVGSKSGVNSPHPNKVHADEVDLMEEDVWNESRNMASSTTPGGVRIAAQDYATSTLKSANGIVAKLVKECEAAETLGFKAPWKIYRSCIFEVAQEVPQCQCAPDRQRHQRLQELGEDPNKLCACDRIVKGDWGEDNPRTMASICKGKFFRSRGWMHHDDVQGKFMQNTRLVWEAQMECRRPEADGLYLPGWHRERYVVKGWLPRPEYGQVWTGTDWGGGAESAVLWCQGPLRVPVRVVGAQGEVVVPVGAYVVFDEYLKAGIGATKLATEVLAREIAWRRLVPGFRVAGRFADMAGRQQRDDWREHTPPLKTIWHLASRDFEPQVTELQGLTDDGLYWVDVERCSRHCDDIEGWRQKGSREVHDECSHSMAASRYLHANVVTRYRRRRGERDEYSAEPAVSHRSPVAMPGASNSDALENERRWRAQLGQHIPRSPSWPR